MENIKKIESMQKVSTLYHIINIELNSIGKNDLLEHRDCRRETEFLEKVSLDFSL